MISKKELQIFLFSWVKTFKRSAIVFLKYFWWLIAAQILFRTYSYPAVMPPTNLVVQIAGVSIAFLFSLFYFYFSLMSIRASVDTKDATYFLANKKGLFGLALISASWAFLPSTLMVLSIQLLSAIGILLPTWFFYVIAFAGATLTIPLFTLTSLFYLDSPRMVRNVIPSFINAFKGYMVTFIPLAIIVILQTFLESLANSFLSVIPVFPRLIFITFLTALGFFFTCAISFFYIKMKHTHPTLFIRD